MKKNFVYIVLSLVLAVSLCACGDTVMDDGIKVTSTPQITNAPSANPNTNGGTVKDTDGIIEEHDSTGNSITDEPMFEMEEDERADVNTQPKVSATPSATVKP